MTSLAAASATLRVLVVHQGRCLTLPAYQRLSYDHREPFDFR
jgi:hypothetical protein